MQLQVHHIVPRSEGGAGDFDNLIALCLTCHTCVHSRVPFTRRFTVEELKQHRDALCQLVQEGKFPPAGIDSTGLDFISSRFRARVRASSVATDGLTDTALRLLVSAANDEHGFLVFAERPLGITIRTGSEDFLSPDSTPREVARYKNGVEQLLEHRLVEGQDILSVTHDGYLLADEIIAAGGQQEE